MKTISTALKNHLAGTSLTTATLWKVTRTDGQVFGFTDHDRDLVFDDGDGAITYEASSGYSRTAIANTMGLSVDNIDVDGVLESDEISEEDLRIGKWDNAEVRISLVNYEDLSQGNLKQLRGRLGEPTLRDDTYTIELRSLAQPWQQQVTRVYTPNCTADLGDSRCGVDLSAFRETGTVVSVVDARTITVTGPTQNDGFYANGLLEIQDGVAAGTKLEINSWDTSTGTVKTWLGLPIAPETGDAVRLTAGCNKTIAHCKDKFFNIENFRGFPFIPNQRKVFRVNSPSE